MQPCNYSGKLPSIFFLVTRNILLFRFFTLVRFFVACTLHSFYFRAFFSIHLFSSSSSTFRFSFPPLFFQGLRFFYVRVTFYPFRNACFYPPSNSQISYASFSRKTLQKNSIIRQSFFAIIYLN